MFSVSSGVILHAALELCALLICWSLWMRQQELRHCITHRHDRTTAGEISYTVFGVSNESSTSGRSSHPAGILWNVSDKNNYLCYLTGDRHFSVIHMLETCSDLQQMFHQTQTQDQILQTYVMIKCGFLSGQDQMIEHEVTKFSVLEVSAHASLLT